MQQNSHELYEQLISGLPTELSRRNARKDWPKAEKGLNEIVSAFQRFSVMSTLEGQVMELKKELEMFLSHKENIRKLAKSKNYARDFVSSLPPKLIKIIRKLEVTYSQLGYEDVDILDDLERELERRVNTHDAEEAKKKAKLKAPLYRHYEYSEEQLAEVFVRLQVEIKAFGEMPQSHRDVHKIKGWLLPYLYAYDSLFSGRWDYWREMILKGTIEESGPIPEIDWSQDRNQIHQVSKMLQDCLNLVIPYGSTISEFADWLLWGLGCADEPARIPESVNEHWYKTFDLALVLKYPTDYMSGLLEEVTSHGHKQSIGYFATPLDITRLMHEFVFAGRDPEDLKTETVYEPCVGCGAMLLPASNRTLFAAGQDINPVAVKLCRVQMMWYAPWYANNPFDPETKKLKPHVKEQLERLL